MIPRPRRSPARSFAVAASFVAALAVGGCSSDDPVAADPSGSGAVSSGTELTITVVSDEGAEPHVMTLTCDPTGGDHPNRDVACTKLLGADASVFEPVPANQACTMIYGGPQTATIVGTLDGEAVDASFSRQNGCEISRWDALGTEVFDIFLQ